MTVAGSLILPPWLREGGPENLITLIVQEGNLNQNISYCTLANYAEIT